MAMTLELIGGSSYLWRWKHGIFHHTYVNVTGHDTDIELGYLARLAPQQRRLAFHRWQHLYLWPLYGLLTIKWQCLDDFRKVFRGRINEHRVPRPTGWELVIFIAGKAVFFALAFGIPMYFHWPAVVLGYYALSGIVMGFLLSVVFQVAHCVEEAEFPEPRPSTGRLDHAWAVHQAETSVDFSRQSRLLSWLLGGLNFQIEHHLFPRISHVHYPAISGLVEQTCREFGIRYTAHRVVLGGDHARTSAGCAAWGCRIRSVSRRQGPTDPGCTSRNPPSPHGSRAVGEGGRPRPEDYPWAQCRPFGLAGALRRVAGVPSESQLDAALYRVETALSRWPVDARV